MQPIWKIGSSIWIISPRIGVKKNIHHLITIWTIFSAPRRFNSSGVAVADRPNLGSSGKGHSPLLMLHKGMSNQNLIWKKNIEVFGLRDSKYTQTSWMNLWDEWYHHCTIKNPATWIVWYPHIHWGCPTFESVVQHVAASVGVEENSMEKGCSGQRCGIFLEASYGHEYFFIFKELLIALSEIPCNKTTNNTKDCRIWASLRDAQEVLRALRPTKPSIKGASFELCQHFDTHHLQVDLI